MKNYLFLCLIFLASCAIPLNTYNPKFPTKVYYEGNEVEEPYTMIGDVYHSDERLKKDPNYKASRGYSSEEKEMLLYELSKKAKALGADAVINVSMQLYMTETAYGYNLRGKAVRFLNPFKKP